MNIRLIILGSIIAVVSQAADAAGVNWSDPSSIVAAAVAQHPSIHRLQAEITAARERVAPEGSQPNPMVMGGLQDKQIDLTNDEMMSMYMVGARQTFVRKSKREARRDAAELIVDSLEHQLESTRAELEREVLFAYWDIAEIDGRQAALEQVRETLEAIVAAARVRYEVGGAIQADVVRAQLQAAELERDFIALRGSRRAAIARLLPLIGAPPAAEVPRLTLPAWTENLSLQEPATIPDEHPALASLASEVARQDLAIRLAQLAKKPDVELEATYGSRPYEKDMFSIVASIELPVRREKLIDPRIRAAVAGREAASQRIQELRRSLEAALGNAVAVHDEASQQLRLNDEVLIPQARLALESTLAAYQSGKATLEAIRAAEATYLDLQVRYYELLARHLKAVIDFKAIRRGARGGASSGSMSSSGASTASAAASNGPAMSSPQM